MARRLNDNITLDFTTHNPSTGEVSDADTPPTCEVFEEASDTPILTPTVVRRSGKTGDYRVTFVADGANGFEENKAYNVIVEASMRIDPATVKAAKARIASFTLEPLPVTPPTPPAHFRG